MTYGEDLAHVHDEAFGDVAEAAASAVVRTLRRRGHRAGVVTDLGCGSGVFAAAVAEAGYIPHGVDTSRAMVALARRRAPSGTFRVGSFVDAKVPSSVAVVLTGEVLNYATDARNGPIAVRDVFRRAEAALAPGGVLVFDALLRGAPVAPSRTFHESPGWAVLVSKTLRRNILERRIVTFRKVGPRWRRTEETHRVRLLDGHRLVRDLEALGFRVERRRRYGSLRLRAGHEAFFAFTKTT